MRRITFDIETEGNFKINGDFSALEVTVLGIHDSESNALKSFYRDELHEAWPLFEAADIIVGYNSEHFDIPILNKYYAGDLTKLKSIDLLKEVKNVLGRRLKLDNLAEATLGRKKTGKGIDASVWWAEGLHEKVRDYCLSDVAITNELYIYAKTNGFLKYQDYDGLREIKLDTSGWEKKGNSPALTHTLPF